MEGAKEYFLRLLEAEYFDLPQHLKEKAVVYYNDYQQYKDNPQFQTLNKAYRKSKRDLEDWKYEQRHGT